METGQASNKLYHESNLRIIFAITLMAVLGVSSITPAFPQVVEQFNISEMTIGLLITVFTLPGIFLTPILGVLADRWGRKEILVPSLFLFGIAGFACSFVSDFKVLLLLRFVQGIGAASLGSLNATLIGDLYSGKARVEAMGYNASVLSIGTAGYPAIGGFLAIFAWNFPFALPVLAIPIGLIVLFKLNIPQIQKQENLGQYLLSAFKPMRNSQVYILFTAGIMTFIILYGALLTYFPFLVQNRLGGNEFNTGIMLGVMSLATAVTSFNLGRLIERFSVKLLLKSAFIFFAIALIMVPFVPSLALLLIPSVIFGMGQGINFPSNQTLLTGLAPTEYRAAFMSINGMVLRVGQTLGPFVMGFIFSFWGMDGVFIIAAFLSILMSIFLFVFLK